MRGLQIIRLSFDDTKEENHEIKIACLVDCCPSALHHARVWSTPRFYPPELWGRKAHRIAWWALSGRTEFSPQRRALQESENCRPVWETQSVVAAPRFVSYTSWLLILAQAQMFSLVFSKADRSRCIRNVRAALIYLLTNLSRKNSAYVTANLAFWAFWMVSTCRSKKRKAAFGAACY
jgi:hypothetical protein